MKNKNLPSGTRDEFGTEAEVKETIQNKLFQGFRRRGFRKLTTPVLEYSDVFQPLNAENYRPYQLLDEQGQLLVLRPDLTLPVARVMSTTGIELPVKWYYGGDVYPTVIPQSQRHLGLKHSFSTELLHRHGLSRLYR